MEVSMTMEDVHGAVGSGKEMMDEAASQASAVAGEAREQISSLVQQTRDELSGQLDQRAHQAATGLRGLSDQLRALSEGRPAEAGRLTGLLDDARRRVQSYATSLDERGPRAMVDDVAAFARRRPGAFLMMAAVAGFGAGRLARAGASTRHEQESTTGAPAASLPRGGPATPLPSRSGTAPALR
jgi:ElaB/YqjD/DUF883 family membrane-anchored ribosome-binding protein